MAKKKGRKKPKPSLIRMAINSTGAWVPVVENATALMATGADLGTLAQDIGGKVVADYSGYNPMTQTWELERLAIGYGPMLILKGVERFMGRIRFPI